MELKDLLSKGGELEEGEREIIFEFCGGQGQD